MTDLHAPLVGLRWFVSMLEARVVLDGWRKFHKNGTHAFFAWLSDAHRA